MERERGSRVDRDDAIAAGRLLERLGWREAKVVTAAELGIAVGSVDSGCD